MTIYILTIFPEMVRAILGYGVIGRAVKKEILEIKPIDFRDFATDKHRSVDDKPFGGGPGMVMRVDIVDAAISKLKAQISKPKLKSQSQGAVKVILLSPQGKLFNQRIAEEYSKLDDLILISGRYEGVDERVREHLADEELSIGEYVLSGGEIPAMVIADAVARLLPGVVGDPDSLVSESFSTQKSEIINHKSDIRNQSPHYDFPQYTQPAEYKGWRVPEVLRLGDHQKIREWREKQRGNN